MHYSAVALLGLPFCKSASLARLGRGLLSGITSARKAPAALSSAVAKERTANALMDIGLHANVPNKSLDVLLWQNPNNLALKNHKALVARAQQLFGLKHVDTGSIVNPNVFHSTVEAPAIRRMLRELGYSTLGGRSRLPNTWRVLADLKQPKVIESWNSTGKLKDLRKIPHKEFGDLPVREAGFDLPGNMSHYRLRSVEDLDELEQAYNLAQHAVKAKWTDTLPNYTRIFSRRGPRDSQNFHFNLNSPAGR